MGQVWHLSCPSFLIDDNRFLKKMCALAAVGTIADVVPLVGDNHCIAREGLRYINQREIPVGLLALINATGLKKIDEQNIGFTIAPMLNAAGRLEDHWSREVARIINHGGLCRG